MKKRVLDLKLEFLRLHPYVGHYLVEETIESVFDFLWWEVENGTELVKSSSDVR